MDSLAKILEDLKSPEAYPGRPKEIHLIQTHISAVFVTDTLVYKIKKPVNFGFLDFSTVEKRKFYCEEELRLNRRLSPDIYLDVLPIGESGGRVAIGGGGTIIDYAVVMKRLPGSGMMDVCLSENRVTTGEILRIIELLVPFYRSAKTGRGVDEFGTVDSFRINTDENFEQTRSFIGETISEAQCNDIREFTESFYVEYADLFVRRIADGRIRELHGDLHSRNICITPEKIYIYDCIEFNERFRMGDVAQDVGFLSMDLDFNLVPGLSRFFIDEFVRKSSDEDLNKILDFYACYRAYVRGKVLGFALNQPEIDGAEKDRARDEAKKYFHLAHYYSRIQKKPMLVVMFGLSGTGKSKTADFLQADMRFELIRSDVIRKEILGINPQEHRYANFGEGIYSSETTRKTYDELFRRAEQLLAEKRSVVLDASFLNRGERDGARKIAEKNGADFLIIETHCDDSLVKTRLMKRMKKKAVSDATIPVYEKQKEVAEFPDEIDRGHIMRLDTSETKEHNQKKVAAKILLGQNM